MESRPAYANPFLTDNVHGKMLDAGFARMAPHRRYKRPIGLN